MKSKERLHLIASASLKIQRSFRRRQAKKTEVVWDADKRVKRIRHGIAFLKLGRSTEDRLQLLRNLVTSLIKHEAIETTVARGKEVKRIAEKVAFFIFPSSLDLVAM